MSEQEHVNERLSHVQKRLDAAQVTALESVVDLFGTMLPGDPRDLYDDVDGFMPSPPGGVPPYYWNNRGRGEVLPVYTTWLQLKYLRDRSRRLCMENPFAICATENRRNYVVGDGFVCRATGPDKLAQPAQQVLDLWAAAVDLAEYEIDSMERLDKDGEFFLRFFPRESGLVEMRFIEPEHVKDQIGDPWNPRDSFGIKTATDDVENVLAYQVMLRPWESETPTEIRADEIIHVRLNVPRNAKRGLPTFYPVETNLRRANKLLTSMAAMADTRAKIALIRKFLNASGAAVKNMTDSLTAGRANDPVSGQTVTMERLRYGSILNSTGNIQYEMPSANVDAPGFVEVLQAELRAIAARLNMPEWMLTADASNANLASSLVAESPSTKQFRRLQRMLCRTFGESRHPQRKSAAWRQLEHSVSLGVLDPDTLTEIVIQCEGPSLVVRDKHEEAATNEVYYNLGIKSKATISQELGLDREQEMENFARDKHGETASIAANAPTAVRPQESTLHPGDTNESGEPHEPEQEPNLNDYIYNKFKGMYGEQEEPDRSTGYILSDGRPVKMGRDNRDSDHREALPSRAARARWGWESETADRLMKYVSFSPLQEMLHKTGAARTHVGHKFMSFEYAHPLTGRQKRQIKDFVAIHKPAEVVFSRQLPKVMQGERSPLDNANIYRHKHLSWDQVEDYLNGVQEEIDWDEIATEVLRVMETTDQNDKEHDPLGRYVQPEFLTPPFEHLTDPLDKVKDIQNRTAALQLEYKESIRQYQKTFDALQQAATPGATGEPPDPATLEKLDTDIHKAAQDVRKKYQAIATATKELQAVQPGVIKPDAKLFRRIITNGPYVIVSAGKNSNNQEHTEVPPEEFAERHKQLGRDLIADGRKVVELKGKYAGLEEPSWLAAMPKEHWHAADTHGYKYGQESIIRSVDGNNELKFVTGPSSGMAHTGVGYQELPDAADNYSEYTDPAGEKVKFALNLDFDKLENTREEVAQPTSRTGFTSSDFRDMLHSYLPPTEHVDEMHDPREVVKFYHDLSDKLKHRTGFTLKEVLADHTKGKLHTDAGEAVVAGLIGSPYTGHNRGPWDAEKTNKKGVGLAINTKMTASPTENNQRFREGTARRQRYEDLATDNDRFPVMVGINPAHTGEGMIVAHKGTDTFSTRDTPDLRQKVNAGHAAVLANFSDLDQFLYDPAAVADAQRTWAEHVNSIKPTHLSTAKTEVTHRKSLNWFGKLKALAARGDKTAVKRLKDFALPTP